MNKIKLCIFDMDGLLLDSERYVWSVGQRKIMKEYGKETTDEFLASVMGFGHDIYIKMLHEKFGNDFPAIEYLKKIQDYYANVCETEAIPLRPGVIEILEFLKKNNIPISLGTSTEKKYAEIALKKSGIYKYFDYAVYGDQVEHGKPRPDIFLKSVEHYNFKPEECVVFEDTPTGAMAAYSGNINLIMVPDLKQPTSLDKEKAFAIINSLQEAIPIIQKINNI